MSALTIMLIELIAGLTLISGFFIWRHIRNYRADHQALLNLTEKIRSCREERTATLRNFLHENCGYEDTSAGETAKLLVNFEQKFYKTIMDIYQKRDATAVKDLDQITERLTTAYRNLTADATSKMETSLQQQHETATVHLAQSAKELEQKNNELQQEVSSLHKEMEVTVTEYTSAFRNRQTHKPAPAAAPTPGEAPAPTDQEIEHVELSEPAPAVPPDQPPADVVAKQAPKT